MLRKKDEEKTSVSDVFGLAVGGVTLLCILALGLGLAAGLGYRVFSWIAG